MKFLLNFGLRQDLFVGSGAGVGVSNTGSEKWKALAHFLFSMDPLPYLSTIFAVQKCAFENGPAPSTFPHKKPNGPSQTKRDPPLTTPPSNKQWLLFMVIVASNKQWSLQMRFWSNRAIFRIEFLFSRSLIEALA